ncbi:hypothetical protein [Reichenbachiella ulvae]|uniref:Uncharacterized protein n=1 Tax=Reichenbachiella ulvae TaxID=2980104 RepID=A0ABT3D159_9BACT|nr:hypothetical protein [Reichenbachiella ulvae]MCV9389524.1 hypothetical protein [Reichenbachiella ulvae]
MTKSKHIILPLCLLVMSLNMLMAQPYGNEWINYNQQYYKIQIAENGIYQLTRTQLATAGVQ